MGVVVRSLSDQMWLGETSGSFIDINWDQKFGENLSQQLRSLGADVSTQLKETGGYSQAQNESGHRKITG